MRELSALEKLMKVPNRDIVVSYVGGHKSPEIDPIVAQVAHDNGFELDEFINICKTQKSS